MSKQNENDVTKRAYQSMHYTQEQIDEFVKCADDPLYFIRNFMKIQHPTKGSVPFITYPYQDEMITTFHAHNKTVALCARQMGKTTCAAAFLLWKAMFNTDCCILIAANKFVQAMEIMDRIRYAYENLPDFLRAGVKEYNKGNIVFDNGSRIISRATTPDAGRGLSITLLYLDEFAFVRPNIASEFWTAIQPTLSTGGACIVTSTPNNDEDQFAQIWFGANKTFDEFGNELPNGVGVNGFKAVEFDWRHHPDRDEKWAREFEATLGKDKFMREFENKFVSFDETLIDSLCLASLQGKSEEFKLGEIRWYERPKANRTYLVALDPSLGTGRDYAAIQVYSLPELNQVAEWRHNKTDIKGQIRCLLTILHHIWNSLCDNDDQMNEPEIYWTVENNAIGEAALIVIEDTGEENFPGIFVHEPKGSSKRKGLNTTKKNKVSACSRIKSLVESHRMSVNSKALIKELKNFVAAGGSFQAKWGETDDLISASLLCVRMLGIIAQYGDEMSELLKENIDMGELDEGFQPMPIMIG